MSLIPLGDARELALAASIGLLPGTVGAPLSFAVSTAHHRAGVYDLPYQLCCQGQGGKGTYNPYSVASYYVPTMYPREVSDALRLLSDINEWTGPADTSLAGSLFPVPLFTAWGAGGAPGVQPDQYERLTNVHNVIEHIHTAVGRDARRTVDALTRSSTPDGDSALTYLMAGRYDEAYLTAIRVLRPVRVTGLVTGRRARRALDATVAFLDED